jgi:UDP-N-acetylglucosamine acyltransferase
MIHAQALVDPKADLADDIEVGPFSIIGPGVKADTGCVIGPHVVLTGRTTLGKDNRIFQFASIGEDPQDIKYDGEDTELVIGDRNNIRELCTFNKGTAQGGGITRIGNDNWIMACVHIAHDCQIGSNIIMANNSTLAGHVSVGDWAILGGYSLVHQFVSIGAHSFVSFASYVNQSIPPFVTVAGEKAKPKGINSEGLKRRGFSSEEIQQIRRAYRIIYRDGLPLKDATARLHELAAENPQLQLLADFLSSSERGIIR